MLEQRVLPSNPKDCYSRLKAAGLELLVSVEKMEQILVSVESLSGTEMKSPEARSD